MFLLACFFAALPLAFLAGGASHELLGPRLAARRQRRERGRLSIRQMPPRAAMVA